MVERGLGRKEASDLDSPFDMIEHVTNELSEDGYILILTGDCVIWHGRKYIVIALAIFDLLK